MTIFGSEFSIRIITNKDVISTVCLNCEQVNFIIEKKNRTKANRTL